MHKITFCFRQQSYDTIRYDMLYLCISYMRSKAG